MLEKKPFSLNAVKLMFQLWLIFSQVPDDDDLIFISFSCKKGGLDGPI